MGGVYTKGAYMAIFGFQVSNTSRTLLDLQLF